MTNQLAKRTDKSIALIGYRGSGKSTVGRVLAAKLQLPLVDTDEVIVRAAGMSISRIFVEEGVEWFRERERQTVAQAVASDRAIISVGGGAVLDPTNVALLKASSTVVWLTAGVDALVERVSRDLGSRDTRPALTSQPLREEVDRVLRDRISLYENAADYVIDTENRTPDEIADLIVAALQA